MIVKIIGFFVVLLFSVLGMGQGKGNLDSVPSFNRAVGGFDAIEGTSTAQNFNLVTFTFTVTGTVNDGSGMDSVTVMIWDDGVVMAERSYQVPVGTTQTVTDQLFWSGPIGTSAPGIGVCLRDSPGGVYLECVDPFFTEEVSSSLLFRESNHASWECLGFGADCIPGWDHSALQVDNLVYESHPNYPAGSYWDPLQNVFIGITPDFGVQAQHSLGSFQHDSTSTSSPTANAQVPIEYDLALGMEAFIQTQMGKEFLSICGSLVDLNCWRDTLNPDRQKAYTGEEYTCVGLVERAAEEAGHRDGQGFVPNWMESAFIPFWGDLPLLSPQLLYWSAQASLRFGSARRWIAGVFDPVDFMLTDPEGRRFGFTEAMGMINEIPDAFFGGDGYLEQFMILDPPPGTYQLQLFGLDEAVQAALVINVEGYSGNSMVFEDFLGTGEIQTIEGVALCDNIARDLMAALPQWPDEEEVVGLVQILNQPCGP